MVMNITFTFSKNGNIARDDLMVTHLLTSFRHMYEMHVRYRAVRRQPSHIIIPNGGFGHETKII